MQKTIDSPIGRYTISDRPPSQMRQKAEADPNYQPYCLRCMRLQRMDIVERYLWKCSVCGAVHDERMGHEKEPTLCRDEPPVDEPTDGAKLSYLIDRVKSWTDAGDTQFILADSDLTILLDSADYLEQLEHDAGMWRAARGYRELEATAPWRDKEIVEMTAFARGYVTSQVGAWIDEWVTFADDVDIHFLTNGEEATDRFGAIEAWAYRRRERPEIGDRDCTDELKLDFVAASMANDPKEDLTT